MGPLSPVLLGCLGLVLVTGCTAQTCTTNPDSCADRFVCSPALLCEIPPDPEQDMMAYIILGVVLGVLVILVIVIMIIACGRWNWSWRMMNSVYGTNGKSTKRVASMKRVRQVIRKAPKRRKIKLKLGIKKNTIPVANSTSSTAFFVMGDSTAPDPTPVLPQPTGPFVAKLDLDKSNAAVPVPVQAVLPPSIQTAHQTPGVSHVACPDVHDEFQIHGRNIDIHSLVPISSLYPHLHEVVAPQVVNVLSPQQIQHQMPAPVQHQMSAPMQHQMSAPIQHQMAAPIQYQMSAPIQHQMPSGHQINIHAPVPSVTSAVHHQQIVTQPGLYPQLGTQTGGHTGHIGGQTPTQGLHVVHTHSAPNLSPPAYQTMERKV